MATRLLLTLLEKSWRWHTIDILAGGSRSSEFLLLNPNGRVPVLVLEDGRALTESNAILYFLAIESAYLPVDPFARACVLQWQAFEQYSHEPFIATSRFIRRYLGNPPDRAADLAARQAPGHAALAVMEQRLRDHAFFVAERYSIADISLYAYTHVAEEGGFSLARFPAVRAWLARVATCPGHVPMNAPPPA